MNLFVIIVMNTFRTHDDEEVTTTLWWWWCRWCRRRYQNWPCSRYPVSRPITDSSRLMSVINTFCLKTLHLALYLCHNPQSVNRVIMMLTITMMVMMMMMIFARDDYEMDPPVWLVDWNCQWCDSVSPQKSEKVELVQNLLCRRSSDKIYSRNGELMKEKKGTWLN